MSSPRLPRSGEGIAITSEYPRVSRTFALVKPKIVVDGQEVPDSGWGRTVIPVPPGHHEVHVHTPYVLPRRVGPADYTVAVQPDQWVELEYKTPVWNFSPGALGPPRSAFSLSSLRGKQTPCLHVLHTVPAAHRQELLSTGPYDRRGTRVEGPGV